MSDLFLWTMLGSFTGTILARILIAFIESRFVDYPRELFHAIDTTADDEEWDRKWRDQL